MNGDAKRNIAIAAVALGVGVALGSVLDDKTKHSFVGRGREVVNGLAVRVRSITNRYVDRSKTFARHNPAETGRRYGRRARALRARR